MLPPLPEYAIRGRLRKPGSTEIRWGTSASDGNLLGYNMGTINKNIETLIDAVGRLADMK
jgi:hypothetical protein